MSTRNRIPSLLAPYLRLPPELGLALITGTLECTPTWLTARVIASLISPSKNSTSGNEDGTRRQVDRMAVILVSWMRDAAFWKAELRRTVGLDVTKLEAARQFTFIDCLTPFASTDDPLQDLASRIMTATTNLATHNPSRKIHLVLDGPDTILALSPASVLALNQPLLNLRTQVHSCTLVLSADLPFVRAATSTSNATPLEQATAAFLVQQAHLSRLILSVRPLATGAARDVSGVLRVTGGGKGFGVYDWEYEDDGADSGADADGGDPVEGLRDAEFLYLVSRDGGVEVFDRGGERG